MSALSALPDPRCGNAQRHSLLDTLVMALTASIRGAESGTEIADFGRDREALLREFLALPGGLPSHDAYSRLFRLLDPVAFAGGFSAFLGDFGEDGPGVVAIDGKTLRRSFDRAAARSPLHVVTTFAAQARVVICQVAAGTKEREITAARQLRGLLALKGVLVTGDALHGQGETARLIAEKGGTWLFTLKDNRPSQRAEVDAWFADPLNRPGTCQAMPRRKRWKAALRISRIGQQGGRPVGEGAGESGSSTCHPASERSLGRCGASRLCCARSIAVHIGHIANLVSTTPWNHAERGHPTRAPPPLGDGL